MPDAPDERSEAIEQRVALDRARLLEAERAAREALAASETRYRELYENVSDVVYVHDMAGRITEANRAGAQMMGYALDEVIGKNIAEPFDADEVERVVSSLTARRASRPSAKTSEVSAT